MRLLKKMNAALALALTLALVAPVVTPVTNVAVAEAATIKLSKKKKNLKVGKSFKLKVKGTSEKTTFASSDSNIATVDSNGKVTAIAPGKTTITATVADNELSCPITVKGKVNPAVVNAPFEAKQILTSVYTAAIPEEWTYESLVYKNKPAVMIFPDTDTELSYIMVTHTPNKAARQENFELWQTLLKDMYTLESLEASLDEAYTVTDLNKEVIETSLGNSIVTTFTATADLSYGEFKIITTSYLLFSDEYITEVVSVFEVGNSVSNFDEATKYFVNSFVAIK